jgi:hypothetical protein
MEGLRVSDPAESSGIDYVAFKYLIPGYVDELTLGPDFDQDDGEWEDGAWEGTYSGSLTLEVFPGWCLPDTEDEIEIHLWVKAEDNDNNYSVVDLGWYTMDEECDDVPTSTATPSRTPTPSDTPEPTATPT